MNSNIFKNKFESKLFLDKEGKTNFIQGGLRTKGTIKKKNSFLISIVTVTLNSEKYIEETIQSVLNQKNKNFEYIIIDGGSSDKTIDIIKKYENKIDYWVSEPDKGLYDAFNKGLTLVAGDIVGFVNSDDVYTNESLSIVEKYFKKYPNLDFLFGGVKKHWGLLYGYKPWKIFFSWGFYSSHSTGFFIKLESAKKVGFYNLKYKYSSDYDLFYRMIVKFRMKGMGTKKNEIFGHFRRGGYSSKISFLDHFFEEIKIRLDNGQNKLLVLFVIIFKFLKNINRI
mgnify:FL=1|tara:strand:+ start:215 stop:1060 length:846 start_codon:yes stop_codon:yes gene_type:complete